jgi:hypothetical protein
MIRVWISRLKSTFALDIRTFTLTLTLVAHRFAGGTSSSRAIQMRIAPFCTPDPSVQTAIA